MGRSLGPQLRAAQGPEDPAAQLATSASVSVFNVSVAAGAAIGGIAIDATGTAGSALVVGVALLLTATLAASIRQPRTIDDLDTD